MALKRLKTLEFEGNPDHLPENRKNQRKMEGVRFDYACKPFKSSVKSS